MAFSKIIISQAINVAKKSNKLNDIVEDTKQKFLDKITTEIESKIPIPLPFNIQDALLGNISLDKSTAMSYLPSKEEAITMGIDKIPENIKIQINETLDNLENTLNQVIGKTNQIKSGLNTLLLPLNTLNVLGSTLNTITTSVDLTITTIKLLPIPSSVPPGVGIPLNVIIGLSDGLEKAKDVNSVIKGATSIISPIIGQIQGLLGVVFTSLSSLDAIFIPATSLIAFLRTFINFGSNATPEDFDNILKETINNTVNSLPLTGLSSDDEANSNLDGDLEERLKPNSTNPIFHRGYRLILQYDDKNQFSFPSRRIKGENKNNFSNPILYHLEDNSYSYSSSLIVMVEEMKNRIDNSLAIPVIPESLIPPIPEIPPNYSPFSTAGDFEGEIRKLGNEYYQYSSTDENNLWSKYVPNTTPFNSVGKYDGEKKLYRKSPLVVIPYMWVEKLGGSINTQTLKWIKGI